MVTFTHLEAGTRAATWLAAERWRSTRQLDLADVERLLVVAAHPDDESLGAGGLLARASERGISVRVVIASDGEGSHPDSPTHAPERLTEIRRREALDAAALLGGSIEVEQLGLPDGGLQERESELRGHLDAVLAELGGPGTLVVAPWREDGHPDHEAAGRAAAYAAATAGARMLEYPIWLWHWAAPDAAVVPWERLVRLHLSDSQRGRKRAAILAHASQCRPLSAAPGDEAVLSPAMLEHFAHPFEAFIEPGRGTVDAAHFEAQYAGDDDPWGYETRWYEARKRAVTLAALPHARYARALEVGCSIGVLTAELAPRCESLLGVDVAPAAIRQARARLAEHANVELEQIAIPTDWPEGSFDLIVLSEVGYYWSHCDLRLTLLRAVASLDPGGVLVACHWRHPDSDSPLSGDEVHAELARTPGIVRAVQHVEEDFLLDVYRRPPALSVARETGVI